MKKLGLIINPVAGMGGSVGLKGTDGVVEEAIRRGAVPGSGKRAEASLKELLPFRGILTVYTKNGEMGGNLAREMGFHTVLLKDEGLKDQEDVCGLSGPSGAWPSGAAENVPASSAADTIALVKAFVKERIDLLLFAGGDGTARNIYEAAGTDLVTVGIPAGVKIHSPVYAKNPAAAGRLAALYLTEKIRRTEEREVLDIDENAYRAERIDTSLYGFLKVPMEKTLTQNRKAPTPLTDAAAIRSMAYEVVDNMEPDTWYLVGAGTTTRGVMELLGLKNTLIGVDLVRNRKLVANDLYGKTILTYIKGQKAKLIVTITGGQGCLFGRGNQQLTPEILRAIGKENIIILATHAKLSDLHGKPLFVDTPDETLNKELSGFYRVITGYKEYTICRVSEPIIELRR